MQSQEAIKKAEVTQYISYQNLSVNGSQPSKFDDGGNSYGYQKVLQHLQKKSSNNKNQDSLSQTWGNNRSGQPSQMSMIDGQRDKSAEKRTIDGPSTSQQNQQQIIGQIQSSLSQQASNIKNKVSSFIQNNYSSQKSLKLKDSSNDNSGTYLRIGDIICFSFYHKSYIQKENESLQTTSIFPPIQNNRQASSVSNQQKKDNESYTEYKGILWSDSVTNKNLNVIPKTVSGVKEFEDKEVSLESEENQINGNSQFMKCLFRIETAQECEYSMIHQKLESELIELEQMIHTVDDEHYGSLLSELISIQKKIKQNQYNQQEETRNNEYELNMNLGKKITYGQRIQLKHVFSGLYLSLNQKQIANEHGCVAMQLQEQNNSSWFTLRPSQKIREQGQAVSYQDNFYIQNFDYDHQLDKYQFYVHVSADTLAEENIQIVEVNGSNEPSRFKAKLFTDLSSQEEDEEAINSGDTIRLLHKELDGFLTINDKDVKDYSEAFPDFLQDEINQLFRIKQDKTASQEEGLGYKSQNENPLKYQIFVERDQTQLQETNTHWEIQKIKPFSGGSSNQIFNFITINIVLWDDCYRIKHIGSGRFLATSRKPIEMYLKELPDLTDTIFFIRRDTYQQNSKDQLESIKSEDLIILQSYHAKYLQIGEYEEQFDDNIVMPEQQAKGSQNFAETFNAQNTLKSPIGVQTPMSGNHDKQNLQNQLENAAIEYNSKVDILLGDYQKHEISKMVFQIKKIPHEQSLITYQGADFFGCLVKFYNYINDWGVSLRDSQAVKGFQFFYNRKEAEKKEEELSQKCEEIISALNNLYVILAKAKEKSSDSYNLTQNYLADQGVLHILIKLIELIYYKTVSPIQREKPFDKKKTQPIIDDKSKNKEESVYEIANEHLHSVQELQLRIIYQLIKSNVNNSNIVTQFDDVFFSQLKRHETKIISKIFAETYKRAQYILSDGAFQQNKSDESKPYLQQNISSMDQKQNLFKHESALAHHKSQQKQYEGKIQKWASMLDTISWKNEDDETIAHQILFMKVISMMCVDPDNHGNYKYQLEAIHCLFEQQPVNSLKINTNISINGGKMQDQQKVENIPMKIEYVKAKQIVKVMFYVKGSISNHLMFETKNPQLKNFQKIKDNQSMYISFDLEELCLKSQALQPYIDYIIAVIDMYKNLCLSRNMKGIEKVKSIGFTYETVYYCIYYLTNINGKIKAGLIDLAKVLFVDSDSFLLNYKSQSRIYTWNQFGKSYDKLNSSDVQGVNDFGGDTDDKDSLVYLKGFNEQFQHRQIYLKENEYFDKIESKMVAQNGPLNNDIVLQDQDFDKENDPNRKNLLIPQISYTHQLTHLSPVQAEELRKLITEFFFQNNTGFENMRKQELQQMKSKYDTYMKLINSYLDLATSLLETQQVDYKFVNKMIKVAAMIFIKYDIDDFKEPAGHKHDQDDKQQEAFDDDQHVVTNKMQSEQINNNNPHDFNQTNTHEDHNNTQIGEYTPDVQSDTYGMPQKNKKKSNLYQEYKRKYGIVQFLDVANDQLKDYRNKMDQLEIKTLRMMQHVCKLRLDSQVMIFLRLFKNFVVNDQDIKIEKNSEELSHNYLFDTIFNIFQFSNENENENEDKKSKNELKITLARIFKRLDKTKINKQESEQYRLELEKYDDYIDQSELFIDKKGEIKDIKPIQSSEVQVDQKVSEQKGCNFVLYKLLLFSIFKQTRNNQIKDEAAKVLVMNFRKKQILFEEIEKVDVLMSPTDQEEYLSYKYKCQIINQCINQIVTYNSYERLYIQENQKNPTSFTPKTKLINPIAIYVEKFKDTLKEFILDIQKAQDRQARRQSFLRHLEIHTDLINNFMRKIDIENEQDGDLRKLYKECFDYISYFFLVFSFNNSKNQKSLLPYLNFLMDQIDFEVPNQNLIASILQKNRNTEEGSIFMNFVLRKLEKPEYFKSNILKLLNLMTFESPENKAIILKALVQKKDLFRHHLKLTLQVKNFFPEILKYEQMQITDQVIPSQNPQYPYSRKVQLKDWPQWNQLQLHLICIELLYNCAKNSTYCTLQARKLISVHRILYLLNDDSTPLLVKRHYFRLLFDVYINDIIDVSSMDLNAQQLLKLLNNVMDKDLQKFVMFIEEYKQSKTSIQNEIGSKNNDNGIDKQINQNLMSSLENNLKKYTHWKLQDKTKIIQKLIECSEQIRFLTLFKQRQNKADGFLLFMADFFTNAKKIEMSKELTQISLKYKTFIDDLEPPPKDQKPFILDEFIKIIEEVYLTKKKKLIENNPEYEFLEQKIIKDFSEQTRYTQLRQERLVLQPETRQLQQLLKDLTNLKNIISKQVRSSIPNVKVVNLNRKFIITAQQPYLDDEQFTHDSFLKEEDQTIIIHRQQVAERVINKVREYLSHQNMKIDQALAQVKKQLKEDRHSSKKRKYTFLKHQTSDLSNMGSDREFESDYDPEEEPNNEDIPNKLLQQSNIQNSEQIVNKDNSKDNKFVNKKVLTELIRIIGQNEFHFQEIQAAIDEFSEKARQQQELRKNSKDEKKNSSRKSDFQQNRNIQSISDAKSSEEIYLLNNQQSSQKSGDMLTQKRQQQEYNQSRQNNKGKKDKFHKSQSFSGKIYLIDLEQIFASEAFNIALLPQDKFVFEPKNQIEYNVELQQLDYDIAYRCQQDFIEYTKKFEQFCQVGEIKDELKDLINNLKSIFDNAFENNKTEIIKNFIQNMINSFVDSDHKIYLMKILNMILQEFMESKQDETQTIENKIVYKKRLSKLQDTMNECQVCDLLLGLINKDEKLEVANEAISLLCSLLSESNNKIQEQILNLLKSNKKQYNLLEFIRERLIISTEQLIFQVEEEIMINGKELYQRLKAQFSQSNQLSSKNANSQKGDQKDSMNSAMQYIESKKAGLYSSMNNTIRKDKLKIEDQSSQNEVINILKLIQLFCDNCYEPFQNYLINQDYEIQGNLEGQEFDNQGSNTTENNKKSSVNILTEIANVLIRLTNKLQNSIFSEYHLFQTVEQLFDTLVDFLYGPCMQSQQILGNWKKFNKAVNFYFKQNLGFYQASSTQQKGKLSIFSQCTKLLIALIETDDRDFKKAQLNEIATQIKIKNLKDKMVEIFTYKIGGDQKKQRIYTSNKKCTHFDENNPKFSQTINICVKNEFCQFGHLITFDKKIISAGFNLFIFLQAFKEALPLHQEIQDCDFMIKKEKKYRYHYQDYLPTLMKQASKNFQDQQLQLEDEQEELDKSKWKRALKLLKLEDPVIVAQREWNRIYLASHLLLGKGDFTMRFIDNNNPINSHDISINIMQNDTQHGLNNQKTFARSLTQYQGKLQNDAQNKGFFSKLNCCRRRETSLNQSLQKQPTTNKVQNQSLISANLSHKNGPESYSLNQYNSINNYGTSNKLHSNNKGLSSNSAGNIDQNLLRKQTSQNMRVQEQQNKSWICRQKKNDHKGKLVRVMFRIPPFCTFMGENSRKELIYANGINRESQTDKLEDFFSKLKIIKAEMKSLQGLQRKSRVRKYMTEIWAVFSNISFAIIIIINLLFLIFYQTDDVTNQIYFIYPEAEIIVQLLGIIQAFIAFLVVISYFQKYHGVFWQKHSEQVHIVKKSWFTDFKGSLGYAYGQSTYKSTENEQQLKTILTANSKIKQRKNVNKTLKKFNEILYVLHCFYLGLIYDLRLLFNFLYFVVSILGIYYHFLFSFLLLDIIIKIPLLTSVVQAINQNRMQIAYTLLLLFMIIYIYAFIAFILFRDTYINSGMEGEDPDYNGYCNSLVMCFTSTLNNGLRSGGGIGDTLSQLQQKQNNYWGRWTFDLSFFVLIIIIMLNLIFGIIIDAFADMRDQRNMIEKDVKEKCFICGITRFQFEAKNKSFQDHVLREHNVYAYIYFILYVKKKSGTECTGVEKYVKSLALAEDPKFFPINNSLSLQNAENEDQQYSNFY
eukprot:403366109